MRYYIREIKKSSLIILVILALISVFLLRKIFAVISNNLYYATFVVTPEEGVAGDTDREGEDKVEIIGAVNPQKVIRGSAFELILFIKTEQRTYANYAIAVNLSKINSDIKVNSGEYIIQGTRDWPKSERIQIGPFMVSVPEAIPLGKYSVELALLKSNTAVPVSKYSGTAIEVVSYNQPARAR